jgi:hypothetical protein
LNISDYQGAYESCCPSQNGAGSWSYPNRKSVSICASDRAPRWARDGGKAITSFAIVTTDAAPSVAQHHNRMPVVLDDSQFDEWMRGTADQAAEMMKPYAGAIEAWEIGAAKPSAVALVVESDVLRRHGDTTAGQRRSRTRLSRQTS